MLLPGPKATVYPKTHAKLKLCFKILRKQSCIPLPTPFTHNHLQEVQTPSNFTPVLVSYSSLFEVGEGLARLTPFVPTSAHKSSYFIDVIKHWNALPDEIVSAQSPLIFKNRLHCLYIPALRSYCLITTFLHLIFYCLVCLFMSYPGRQRFD